MEMNKNILGLAAIFAFSNKYFVKKQAVHKERQKGRCSL
jgi:hypothetical protein